MTEIIPQSLKDILNNSEVLCLFFSYLADKESCTFFEFFFLQNLLDFLECIARLRFSCPLSGNCRRIFCPSSLVNLDFKLDLGDNVILEIYKAELLDNISFIFFLTKACLMLHGNKILHGNLRGGSFPSFLWVVTSHLLSLCSQGGEGGWERELFFASLFDCM